FIFFQAEDGIRDRNVTGVQTCALPIWGVCAGGKKPTARSIKQDFETFKKVSKSAQRGEKTFSTRWPLVLFLHYLQRHHHCQSLRSEERRVGKECGAR